MGAPRRTLCRALILLPLLAAACSPVTVSRIGPDAPPRPAGCAVEVLEPGQLPSRPYRAVGVAALANCQDYRTEPCRGWLVDAACGLGGHVAYIDEGGRPDSGLVGPMIFRVTVAAYVFDLPRNGTDDPFAAEMRRRRQPAPDCDGGTGGDRPADDLGRCVE
ncbi:MAG TPA: hypothetical protein VM285_04550 [Polyangia bacterium]|nr:hypothetical protein [Polyangia bacterium]